ncbi:MAG TPA: DNA gyrase modulator [Longimicrobiales bacterium]|nr:DNA gyrase modulator [Longimicrobiales bacterium]
MKRRDFLVNGAIVTAGLGLGLPRGLDAFAPVVIGEPQESFRELAMVALDAARSAGASYADVRINRNRNQSVGTRERQITGLQDTETFGFGVRVLAGGAWGFAASRDLTRDEVARVAQRAAAQARANSAARPRPVELAPVAVFPDAKYETPVEIDPFDVPIADKVDLLLQANEAALGVEGARFVTSYMFFQREEKFFASTEGTVTDQTLVRGLPGMNITAVAPDASDFQSRQSTDVTGRAMGYEWVHQSDLPGNATRWAEEAVAKLSAKPVEPGRYDLVLLPTHLWLTIHESIAHPTELDRIMGYEANYAGESKPGPRRTPGRSGLRPGRDRG